MKRRILLLLVLASVGCLLAPDAAAAEPPPGPRPSTWVPGLIKAMAVRGAVHRINLAADTQRALKDGDFVAPGFAVLTGKDSSVALVFANGAVAVLGPETKLVVTEFLLEPLTSPLQAAELTEEPTSSIVDLDLPYGEFTGDIRRLKEIRGSAFGVRLPVGVVGVRGTRFQVLFRPTGDGRAFSFRLGTAQGRVGFSPTQPGRPQTIVVGPQQEIAVTARPVAGTNRVEFTFPTEASPISVETRDRLQRAAAEIEGVRRRTTISPLELPQAAQLRRQAQRAPAAATPFIPVASSEPPSGPVTVAEAERYFMTWGGYAVWEDDVIEFALDYRSASGGGRQYFEVRRSSNDFRLREITALTRPLIDHGEQVLSPMAFTEPKTMRDAYYRAHPNVVPWKAQAPPTGLRPRSPQPPVRALSSPPVTPVTPRTTPGDGRPRTTPEPIHPATVKRSG